MQLWRQITMSQAKAIQEFMSSPLATHHRYVGKSWFYYDDGDWVWDDGNLRINYAIMKLTDSMGWVRGGMTWRIDVIRRELAARLHQRSLPAHWNASDEPES
jgi:hypothetical protein